MIKEQEFSVVHIDDDMLAYANISVVGVYYGPGKLISAVKTKVTRLAV